MEPRWRVFRAIGRWAGGTILVLGPASAYVAHKYRPRASFDKEFHENSYTLDRQPTNPVEKFLLQCARQFSVLLTSNVFHWLLKSTQRVDMVDIDKLHRYIDNDRDGVPLVTVANHASCLDDPGITSLILPWAVRHNADLLRWTVCTEELCFYHPGTSSFFGAGNAVPIQRGGSLYQKGLATLQSKLNEGRWVHLYAEGRVWQEQGLPLRDEHGRWCSASGRCGQPWTKVGPLKWGIGKLIANSAKLPVVVPIYHTGIQETMPQNRENQLIHFAPQFFENALITIQPGDPVPVQDLIDAYHAGARARAVARNQRRIEAVRAEMQRAGVPAAAIAEQLAPFEAQQRRWAAAAAAAGGAGDSGDASGSGGGVLGWLLRLFGVGTGAAAAAASGATSAAGATVPPLRGAAAGHRPAVANPALVPVNTVEEASDHTGASARVAGLSKPLSPAEAAAAEAAKRGPHQQQHEAMRRSVAELEAAAVHTAAAAAAAARETAVELETRIAATAREIEAQASELAARLRSLRAQKEANEAAAAAAAAAKRKDGKAAAAGAADAKAASAPAQPADSTAPAHHGSAAAVAAAAAAAEELPARIGAVMHDVAEEASAVMHDVAAEAKVVMHDVAEAVEHVTSRWRSSVSVPAPRSEPLSMFPRRTQAPPAAAAPPAAVAPPAAAAGKQESAEPSPEGSTASGPRRVRSSQLGAALQIADESAAAAAASAAAGSATGAPARPTATASELLARSAAASAASASSANGASGAAPSALDLYLSDDPVLEIIPTRTLRTGAIVPQFVEAPLRIKPPDHRFLTPAEAAQEEDFRLQLYSDIASRLEGALIALERQVLARRHAQGHVETRPMETPSLRYGPSHAPPTLPGLPREGEEEDAVISAQVRAIASGDGSSRAIAAAALGTSAGPQAGKVDTSASPVAQAIRRMFGGSKHVEVAPAPAPAAAAASASAAGASSAGPAASNAGVSIR